MYVRVAITISYEIYKIINYLSFIRYYPLIKFYNRTCLTKFLQII